MFTIGADPELFVRNKNTGKFVTAEGLIPGTKKRPRYIDSDYLSAIQVDGVAAEFNTKYFQVENRRVDFVGNVIHIRNYLNKAVGKDNEVVAVPVADFDEDYFKKLSEESRQLGCDPDYNGYTGFANRRPDGEVCYRTGSGHIHIGFGRRVADPGENDYFERCMAFAVELDFYLGIPSLLWDTDNRRRSLYGKAGAFRPKKYGMEYRVLSNVWVGSENLIGYVYDMARECTEKFEKKKFFDEFGGLAADIINNNNIELARQWMMDNKRPMPEI